MTHDSNKIGELEPVLADLARHLIYPPTPDVSLSIRSRLAGARHPQHRPAVRLSWHGLGVSALAAILLAAAVLSASPHARAAVGQWLGLPGVRITLGVPILHPGRLGGDLELGRRTNLAGARKFAAFHVLVPSLPTIRRPDEIYVNRSPPGGSVSLVYRARPGLPETRQTGVGLLVTEFRSTHGQVWLGKELGWRSMPHDVVIGSDSGYWIKGGHLAFRYYRRSGIEEPVWNTARQAGNTLLWEHGGLTLRLESALSQSAAIRVATSLR
jgi:hypothetical protein